jgi:hypothetical protein
MLRTLEHFSQTDIARVSLTDYTYLNALRQEAYERLSTKLLAETDENLRNALLEWADRQERVYKTNKIRFCNAIDPTYWSEPLTWLAALLVVRYGEDIAAWPTDGFTIDDFNRTVQWAAGKIPNGVVLYEGE